MHDSDDGVGAPVPLRRMRVAISAVVHSGQGHQPTGDLPASACPLAASSTAFFAAVPQAAARFSRVPTRQCALPCYTLTVVITFAQGAVTAGFLLLSAPQHPVRPDVPKKIAAPAGEDVVLVGHASGSQIYVCQAGTDQKLSWTLRAPEAELSDESGKNIAHHFAGPTWKHTDGSEVTGKAAARQDAPDPGAIPWLLVNVTTHSGTGILSQVTTIQRIHTKGGQPPESGCDEAHRGAEVKSPYTADYYFYAPSQR
jgi:hypothetical protein